MKGKTYIFIPTGVRVTAYQVQERRKVFTSYGIMETWPGCWVVDFDHGGRCLCSDWMFQEKFKPVETEPDLFAEVQA